MRRRDLLKSMAAAGLAASAGRAACAASAGWREFEVTYRIALRDNTAPARLWAPVPQDALDYQRVVDLSWRSEQQPGRIAWEPETRAPIFDIGWPDPTTDAASRRVEIVTRAATRDRSGFSVDASPEDLALYRRPSKSMPGDGIVLAKAREIIGARTDDLAKARAIYDWVVDNSFRRAETRGCGLGDVSFMLQSGDLGGKCADISSLYVALARAAGLSARDVFGIRVADSSVSKSLGKSGDITKAQHCRAEVYISGKGWLPLDPADVRKVVLEEQAPLDSDHVKELRERLFGSWEMNWVGFNYARDFTLPGAKEGPVGFLMYPYAEARDGIPDWLDPASFSYTISSTELS